jgi:hypothetical protein
MRTNALRFVSVLRRPPRWRLSHFAAAGTLSVQAAIENAIALELGLCTNLPFI